MGYKTVELQTCKVHAHENTVQKISKHMEVQKWDMR